MTKTQQRDYMRDFVKNNSSSVYNQGWTMKKVPASVPVAPTFAADASVSAATTLEVPAAESYPANTPSAYISVEHSVAASTHTSSRRRHKHIAKKRVTPIVDIADAALIKFDSDSGSDDDPLPYAPYAGWEMVPSPLGSVHAYPDMAGHTKHFTTLREILHMVEKTDLQMLLGAVDNLYQREDPDTFALLLTVGAFAAGISILVLSSPWLTAEKELTHHKGTALSWLVQEKTALGKDKSNPLTVSSLLKTTWSSIHHLLTDEVLTSPEQTATGKDISNPFMAVMVCQKPSGYFSSPMIHVPRAKLVFNPPSLFIPAGVWLLLFGWLLLVLFCSCCWNKDAILELTSEDLSRILKLTMSHSRLGEDC
nr:hypothetical protein [Tanacetum cinerariifolium]